MQDRPPLTPLSRIRWGSLRRADWCMHTGDAWDFCESGAAGRDMAPATLPEMQEPRTEAGGPHVLSNKANGRKKNRLEKPRCYHCIALSYQTNQEEV